MPEETKPENDLASDMEKVDGKIFKLVPLPSGVKRVLLCSDCKKDMPNYREADRNGYISPEACETRLVHLQGIPATEALEKPVCVECYLEAFKRVYPGAKLPKMSTEII